MPKTILHSLSPWRPLSKSCNKSLTGLLLSAGIVAGGFGAFSANAAAKPVDKPVSQRQVEAVRPATKTSATGVAVAATTRFADGVHLYGQSPQPEQLGKEYLVFESRQGKVVGAFYMPRSSFDCFYGTTDANKLALTVVDSYEKTTHPYAVALQKSYPVASAGNPAMAKLGLEGHHAIKPLSQNDQRILNVCKANYQKQVWSQKS